MKLGKKGIVGIIIIILIIIAAWYMLAGSA